MKVNAFTVNPFQMNCYIYYDETKSEGVIIDPGAYTNGEEDLIAGFIEKNHIDIKYILNTHGHIDHILGNRWAKEKLKAPLLMHEGDLPLIEKAVEQGLMFGIEFPKPPHPDWFIGENDVIRFADSVLKVIHTPGHSPGGICFVDESEKIIFGGDVLFRNSIGRADLWGGDMNILLGSIKKKLFAYPDEYNVYPGHYEKTTIGEEKWNNPFVN
jgi:glyoxylase-like metal-dependent hydrolase (beta-lactamase superfamily II)